MATDNTSNKISNAASQSALPMTESSSTESPGFWGWEVSSGGSVLKQNTQNENHFRRGAHETRVPCNSPSLPCTPAVAQNFGFHELHEQVAQYVANIDSEILNSSITNNDWLDRSADSLSLNVSLVSDDSEDGFDTSLEMDLSMLSSLQPVTPSKSPVANNLSGLGISGLSKKDGTGLFDGLGIVSVRSSPWRHSDNYLDNLDNEEGPSFSQSDTVFATPGFISNTDTQTSCSGWNLSKTFLEETLLTLTDDPFHGHTLSCIPECESWYEFDDLSKGRSTSISDEVGRQSVSPSGLRSSNTQPTRPSITPGMHNGRIAHKAKPSFASGHVVDDASGTKKLVILTRDVSAATISSGLKRSASQSSPARRVQRVPAGVTGSPVGIACMRRTGSLSGSKSPLPKKNSPGASLTSRWRI